MATDDDTVGQEQTKEEEWHYYMGGDEEHKYPSIDKLFNKQSLTDESEPTTGPRWKFQKSDI